MRIATPGLRHFNAITHEGKAMVFGTAADGSVHYTVHRDGFEQRAGQVSAPDVSALRWENFLPLALPYDPRGDPSVAAQEEREHSYTVDGSRKFLTRSRYCTRLAGAVAPVRLVSAQGHLHVFRQSRADDPAVSAHSILVDRFVLDGSTNLLVPKLEVRFKRSRQRLVAATPASTSGDRAFDALGFRDIHGEPFLEPSTELSLVDDVQEGQFAVVALSTDEHDRMRWHLFVRSSRNGMLYVVSLASSAEGRFEVADRDRAAVLRQDIDLGQPMTGAPAATSYDVQKEVLVGGTPQLMRTVTRVMVTVPTADGAVVALDFGAAPDGTLSRLGGAPLRDVLRSDVKEILLPLSALDDVQAFGPVRPPAGGRIGALERSPTDKLLLEGDADDMARCAPGTRMAIAPDGPIDGYYKARLVRVAQLLRRATIIQKRRSTLRVSPVALALPRGTRVCLHGDAERWIAEIREDVSAGADRLPIEALVYRLGADASITLADAFDITSQGASLGGWSEELQPADAAAVFDGAVLGLRDLGEGKVRVRAFGHRLDDGDAVQLDGTPDLSGTWPATRGDATHYLLDVPWQLGTAINLAQRSRQRRGVELNGGHVLLEPGEAGADITLEWWFKTRQADAPLMHLVARGARFDYGYRVQLFAGRLLVDVAAGSPVGPDTPTSNLADGQWHHLAIVRDQAQRQSFMLLDGELLPMPPRPADFRVASLERPREERRHQIRLGTLHDADAAKFDGLFAECRLWNTARSPRQVRDSMHASLLGSEAGLQGYWRLGALVDGTPKTVPDACPNGHDGIVDGPAYCGSRLLAPTLGDGVTPALRYANEDLVAVRAGARYVESFEFRPAWRSAPPPDAGEDQHLGRVRNAGAAGQAIFRFDYKGKTSRDSDSWLPLDDSSVRHLDFEWLGQGWYRARCEFVVPPGSGIALLRVFDLAAVRSEHFEELSIRDHHLRMLANTVSEERTAARVEPVSLGARSDKLAATLKAMARAELREPWLAQQRDDLVHSLAKLDEVSTPEQDASNLQAAQAVLEALKKAAAEKRAAYERALGDPRNYWCRMGDAQRITEGWFLEVNEGGTTPTQTADVSHYASWKFSPVDAAKALYRISTRARGEAAPFWARRGNLGRFDPLVSDWSAEWTKRQSEGAAKLVLLELDEGKIWSVVQGAHAAYQIVSPVANAFLNHDRNLHLKVLGEGVSIRTEWALVPDFAAGPTNTLINEAKAAADAAASRVAVQEAEVAALVQIARDRGLTRKQWSDSLAAVEAELAALRARIATVNAMALAASKGQYAWPPTNWPDPSRALFTRAARLEFVRPAGELHLTATTEGHVQLNCVNLEGRVQLTEYDATADSRNATFEQWLEPAPHTSVNLGRARSRIVLRQPLPLRRDTGHGDWTIEAWFFHPLPTAPWNTLVFGTEGDCHIVVQDGVALGCWFAGQNDKFRPCGFSLAELAPGWHHVAAVGVGNNEASTTVFYVDGREVGDVKRQALMPLQQAWDSARNTQAPEEEQKAAETAYETVRDLVMRSESKLACIGNTIDGGEPFGRIAELRIWGVALTAEEIEVNSRNLLSGNEPGLLAYYPLNRGDTRNEVGSGYDGIPEEATAWACTAPIGNPGHRVLRIDGRIGHLKLPAGDIQTSGTLEIWLRFDDWSGGAVLGAKGEDFSQFLLEFRSVDAKAGEPGRSVELRFKVGGPRVAEAAARLQPDHDWHHLALVWNLGPAGEASLFVDGNRLASDRPRATALALGPLELGRATGVAGAFVGRMADLRLWSAPRSEQQIRADTHRLLNGDESGLAGWWPLDTLSGPPTGRTVADAAGGRDAAVFNAQIVDDNSLPVGAGNVVTGEYVTYDIDSGNRTAMMRRYLAMADLGGLSLQSGQRREELSLQWVGNAQFNPTLLGYIEGAPPVPSENLTIDPPSYNGATAVELAVDEDVTIGWTREVAGSIGLAGRYFTGVKIEQGVEVAGINVAKTEGKSGLAGEVELSGAWINNTSISTQSQLGVTDTLELRGHVESEAKFPNHGRRFVPKNVGYALVVSGIADAYVTRLKRSGAMLSYHLQPNADLPPDVNTITFMINPAYTMNGSLDGLTGSQPTSERYFAHVPQMRTQYGALYPASYYRLQEAYARKMAIDQSDQRRQSNFANLDPAMIESVVLGGLVSSEVGSADAAGKVIAGATALGEDARRGMAQHSAGAKALWQEKMESLAQQAGKRNIVNTYVWDADGGLHVQSQQFAAAVESTVGGTFELDLRAGFDVEGSVGAAGVAIATELSVMATARLTQTLTRTTGSRQTVSLNINLDGVERLGITDYKDRPYLPGEKVDRYRFMSFFLEGDAAHFKDFFDEVVDPEWLASNDEEARALREIDRSRANKTWRVMHRVTYVERPATMDFGRDLRRFQTIPKIFTEMGPLQESVAKLEEGNAVLNDKLDALIAKKT